MSNCPTRQLMYYSFLFWKWKWKYYDNSVVAVCHSHSAIKLHLSLYKLLSC